MYKHFIVSCLAFSATAIKLYQEPEEQTTEESPITITETDQEGVEAIDFSGQLSDLGYSNFDNMSTEEQSKLMDLLHSTANSSAEVNVGSGSTGTSTGTSTHHSTSTGSHGGDCGCGCQQSSCGCCEEEQDLVNLPREIYMSQKAAVEAGILLEDSTPIIQDAAFELGLTAEDIATMDEEVILPAFELAVADLLERNPKLKELMPDLPTTLESTISAVLDTMKSETATTEDGNTLHSLKVNNGYLESFHAWEQSQIFQEYTPMVYFFRSADCGAACDGKDEAWKKLQKDHRGAAYFQVDIDVSPEIAGAAGVPTLGEGAFEVPHFLVLYGNETTYSGNGSDWATLRGAIDTARKQASENQGEYEQHIVNESVSDPTQTWDVSEDLVAEIAEKFGHTI